jgi:hypothetical protein
MEQTMRARLYTEEQVQAILKESQGAPSPVARWALGGHPRSHVGVSKRQLAHDFLYDHEGRRRARQPLAKTSFLTFGDQVRVATALLNSAEGQRLLQQLDARGPGADFTLTGDVRLNPPVRIHYNMSGTADETRLVPWGRFVLLAGATPGGLYIHTCFADVRIE